MKKERSLIAIIYITHQPSLHSSITNTYLIIQSHGCHADGIHKLYICKILDFDSSPSRWEVNPTDDLVKVRGGQHLRQHVSVLEQFQVARQSHLRGGNEEGIIRGGKW